MLIVLLQLPTSVHPTTYKEERRHTRLDYRDKQKKISLKVNFLLKLSKATVFEYIFKGEGSVLGVAFATAIGLFVLQVYQ